MMHASRTLAIHCVVSYHGAMTMRNAAALERAVSDAGRCRVFIENVRPCVDAGRYPVKRVVDERVVVQADVYADGHDVLAGRVLFRREGEASWRIAPLEHAGNDRWLGVFRVTDLGRWEFTVEGWVDSFATWREHLRRKVEVGQDVAVDLMVGASLVRAAAGRASGELAVELEAAAAAVEGNVSQAERVAAALETALSKAMDQVPDLSHRTRFERELPVLVEPALAQFSAWYEFFPRSAGKPGQHGTFRDASRFLPYVAELGFDIVYLPPVHPIGRTHRKGADNSLEVKPDDPGSPWAIGAAEGGHKAVHPELGTLEDFRYFVAQAERLGLKVALDIAFQASPDHPYVAEHPEWFRKRPDGTIQYAENPPKKYQDIYPFDFECEAWESLWQELLSIFLFWVAQGVRVFRVDNPHTKPLRFWEWCLAEVRRRHPDVIFLAEAFARPKLMYGLAKVGFSQSYTYFTWRDAGWELQSYMAELTQPPVTEFFRPSFWPATPDILPEHLQTGGRPASFVRAVLAATLSSNFGIYGPAFELMENQSRPGSGEYANSEKYEIRHWDLERADSLRWLIAHLNRIRRRHPCFHANDRLVFHPTDNEHLLCFSKRTADGSDIVIVVVNLDFFNAQFGWVTLDLGELGLDPKREFQVHDLLRDVRYQWRGAKNYVRLDPKELPAHVFHVRRHVRGEHDFEYFA